MASKYQRVAPDAYIDYVRMAGRGGSRRLGQPSDRASEATRPAPARCTSSSSSDESPSCPFGPSPVDGTAGA